jgi:hypothetical protein
MKCDRCGCLIEKGEDMEHLGQILCEDCYMDVLSPAKPCDPWAVYTAKSFSIKESALTKLQEKILRILQETGGVEPDVLAENGALILAQKNNANKRLIFLYYCKFAAKANALKAKKFDFRH